MNKIIQTIIIILAIALSYHLGSRDQLNELREQYPHFYNIKAKPSWDACCREYEIDDIWITDSARVNLYTRDGWKRLN